MAVLVGGFGWQFAVTVCGGRAAAVTVRVAVVGVVVVVVVVKVVSRVVVVVVEAVVFGDGFRVRFSVAV